MPPSTFLHFVNKRPDMMTAEMLILFQKKMVDNFDSTLVEMILIPFFALFIVILAGTDSSEHTDGQLYL